MNIKKTILIAAMAFMPFLASAKCKPFTKTIKMHFNTFDCVEVYNGSGFDKTKSAEEIKESLEREGGSRFYDISISTFEFMEDNEGKIAIYDWNQKYKEKDDVTQSIEAYAYSSFGGHGLTCELEVKGRGKFRPSKLVAINKCITVNGKKIPHTLFYYKGKECEYLSIDESRITWNDFSILNDKDTK